ncbi:hypothetical protein ACFQQB_03905 [Nonomuraea rubra]
MSGRSRRLPRASSSPWSKPKQPDNWCEVQKDPVVSVLGFLLKTAAKKRR